MDECPVICTPASTDNDLYNCKYFQKSCNYPMVHDKSFKENTPFACANTDMNVCAGCNESIHDRYYLSAVEKKWHVGCLKCSVCQRPLEDAVSCFSKDEKIYCKIDYFRIFGARKCSKCDEIIMKSELVMRARQLIFHLNCFACDICNTPLTRGDYYSIRNNTVYCRLHFDKPLDQAGTSYMYMPSLHEKDEQISVNEKVAPTDETKMYNKFYTEQSSSPLKNRQKGRPRKRKQKEYESIAGGLDVTTEYLELGFSRDCLGGSSRTKRMRTSFKHHQLRAMKSYFAINHNPDAKDLKQLSQKTGLPKRVLQVWFQNARAKFRRMMSKQDHKSFDPDDYESFTSPIRIMNDGTSSSSAE